MELTTLQKVSKICTWGITICLGINLAIYQIKKNPELIELNQSPVRTPVNQEFLPVHIAKIGKDAEEF